MKIVSFNINGIRARIHQLEAIQRELNPDIIGLQEVKVADEQFPYDDLEFLNYRFDTHGQKGHYGVALASKPEPIDIIRGFPSDTPDAQRRMIRGRYQMADGKILTVFNGYFPQGESRDHPVKFPAKEDFYRNLLITLEAEYHPTDLIVVMGDFNVAPVDSDIGISEDAKKRWLRTGKTSFLPEERDWFKRLTDWGLIDSWRTNYPEVKDKFSWFDYRSRAFEDDPKRGLRIDHILVTQPLFERIVDTGIDYRIRSMEKPSDHCPVWVTFE
ncbi:exodeoxyribonuclease III [Litorivicinus sp.]|nr:exodeoxyribonuclease III [Litorivicinus sp.]MDC1208882.1 exodeoxyribonuclease III [Litorivicinus sp.]MDC1466409.1 exodeoxyribonuclease III [Litorivicinus sp.]